MKMKKMRRLFFCFAGLLLAAPVVQAQDLAKYRGFALGVSVASVLKQIDQKPEDVNLPQAGSTLIQEVTWWPPNVPGHAYRLDSVEQIHFSFYGGQLYKLSVIYSQSSTEGLTVKDLQKSIAAEYGPATMAEPAADSATKDPYDAREKVVATWEDAEHSFNLVRSSFTDRFGLVIYAKRMNAAAELAIAETARAEKEEGPQREAARLKKKSEDLELAREKNQRSFRP